MIVQRLQEADADGLTLLSALEPSSQPAAPIQPLIDRLEKGGVEALLAARMLGNLKAKEGSPALLKSLERGEQLARREVLIALGKIADRGAAGAAMVYLYDEIPEVRAAAATALGSLGDHSHLEPLEALKGDFYRLVRESARGALSQIHSGSGKARSP
jgi:HEAT repeat protein